MDDAAAKELADEFEEKFRQLEDEYRKKGIKIDDLVGIYEMRAQDLRVEGD